MAERISAPPPGRLRIRFALPKRLWLRRLIYIVGGLSVIFCFVLGYYWVHYSHLIYARLGGEQRPIPRIFGRPFDLRPGLGLSPTQLAQRLNDIGYAEKPRAEHPGEFSTAGTVVTLVTRAVNGAKSQAVRVDFSRGSSPIATKVAAAGGGALDHVTLEAPLLTSLATGEKRRYVPISAIPRRMIDAVVAIEDRRFYEHPGVDPIGAIGALITNLRGNKPYLVGGSTLTQQIVKNTFLTPEKRLKRKLQEQFMALVLESRFTKDQILELYLNDVVLGQRGPFEIHGVSEASRLFFDKDISNVSLAEAATIAGVIQSPSRLSPFRNPERALERRNVVLKEMADGGFITKDAAAKAVKEPFKIAQRALEDEAPYFVDYVSQLLDEKYAGLLKKDAAVDVYTTIDLHMQRLAQEAIAEGLALVDKQLSKKKAGQAQAALIAIDPRTGEILALVGGRAYNLSQYDRAVAAHRQPGSAFKPFVYLSAFEKAAADGRTDLTPATLVTDEPTTFLFEDQVYTPSNYKGEYDGPITLRFALAHSRNIVAVKVAQAVGYDQVSNFWSRVGVGAPVKAYPSVALGSFEISPIELAAAYTIFPNHGSVRPLASITRLVESGTAREISTGDLRSVARPDTTYLVTSMMRSVLESGTAAGAREQGFTLEAAGKTGTTNDLRDAWFVGFTPELLTVVWVGFDNNDPIGLSGTQAALPIWTLFMKRALAGHRDQSFVVPEGIVFTDIDRDNGYLATPLCPATYHEAFLAGTEPKELCPVHRGPSRR